MKVSILGTLAAIITLLVGLMTLGKEFWPWAESTSCGVHITDSDRVGLRVEMVGSVDGQVIKAETDANGDGSLVPELRGEEIDIRRVEPDGRVRTLTNVRVPTRGSLRLALPK